MRWKRSNKVVYNLGFHLIWATKYRQPVLESDIQERLKEIVEQKARELGVETVALEVMDDHVHLFVKPDPIHAPHYLVQQFKGITSRKLRQEFPSLRSRLPSLWTRSYYVESVGSLSEEAITKYVENQKGV